jgi:uncharacterized membrane protein YkvA (DUF1232 family)
MPPREAQMSDVSEDKARAALEQLAAESKPEDFRKIDRQFASKIEQLEADGKAPRSMLEQLRTLWEMLKAPDDVVSFKSKTWIMAAMTYFVSPLDLVPDLLGFLGHVDDAIVVRIAWARVASDIAGFERWRK